MKKALLRAYGALSSREFLIWMVGGWIVYYVTYAVWSKEAFAGFVAGLGWNPLLYMPFLLFLIGLYLNIFRVSRERLRKGVFGFVLYVILPLGLALFMTGFVLSAGFRKETFLVTGEGERIGAPWAGTAYNVVAVDPAIREEMLDIEPEAGIFRYEPKVYVQDGGRRSEIGAFPATLIGGDYYHILNFNLAPGIRIMSGGKVLDEGYVIVRLLPPGSEDNFDLPPYPYRFSLRMLPDRTVTKGRERARVYDLKNPSYNVRVLRGEQTVFEGDSRGGVSFDGFSLSFFEPTYWVMLQVVRDPGVPVIVAGLALILLGLPLRALGLVLRIK